MDHSGPELPDQQGLLFGSGEHCDLELAVDAGEGWSRKGEEGGRRKEEEGRTRKAGQLT